MSLFLPWTLLFSFSIIKGTFCSIKLIFITRVTKPKLFKQQSLLFIFYTVCPSLVHFSIVSRYTMKIGHNFLNVQYFRIHPTSELQEIHPGQHTILYQCSGSVLLWYGAGSSDTFRGKTGPDPTSNWKNKNFFITFFLLIAKKLLLCYYKSLQFYNSPI